MSRLISYPLFFILLIACSGKFIRFERKHRNINPEIMDYVKTVESISNGKLKLGKNTIGFVDHIYQNAIGSCNFMPAHRGFEIDIRKDYWKKLTHLQKLFLVAHELRHCGCFEIFHTDLEFKDGCNISYMGTSIEPHACLYYHYDHYYRELQRGCD